MEQEVKSFHKVAFVELKPAVPTFADAIISPSYGMICLATILAPKYKVSVFVEGISDLSFESLMDYDYICFSIKTSSANKTFKMSDELRKRGKIVIIGGTHASFFTESCLSHVDYIILGEGDESLPSLLHALENNIPTNDIPGVCYKKDDKVIKNEQKEPVATLSTISNYDLINDLKPHKSIFKRLWMPVQASRGCPCDCSFCVVSKMFPSYKKRPYKSVIMEINAAKKYSRYIHFVDNNFIGKTKGDREWTKRLLIEIASNNLGIEGMVYVTLDSLLDTEILELMSNAGIKILHIGIDSFNSSSLNCFQKNNDLNIIKKGIANAKQYGIIISASLIANGDHERYKDIINNTKNIIQLGIHYLYYFVLSPYPPMAKTLGCGDRIFLDSWDIACGHYIYYFPKNSRPSEIQNAIIEAHKIFYSWKRIVKSLFVLNFGYAVNLLWRRWLFIKINKYSELYSKKIKRIEQAYYNGNKFITSPLNRNKINIISGWD